MSAICTQCGYENSEHYRFCGMCGALLPAPKPAVREPVTVPANSSPAWTAPAQASRVSHPTEVKTDVSGPSFLGLSEPPSRGAEYLLEDEESHDGGRRRMYAALLLLVIAGILIMWHWRRGGFDWIQRGDGTQTASGPPPAQNNPSLTNGPPVGASASSAPAPSAPMASTSAPKSASPTPPAVTPSDESHMVKPEESKSTTESQEAEKPAPPTSDGTSQDPAASDDAQDTSAESPAEEPKEPTAAPKPAPPVAKPAPKMEAPAAAPVNSSDERFVADGEKYLYGNGVPENCPLAEKNLRAAAAHSNPKALSMLGAMYATGHCVTRDLPTAYRSFARALHQDPNNNRIQRDLEVLWRQMTAEERQAAIKNQ